MGAVPLLGGVAEGRGGCLRGRWMTHYASHVRRRGDSQCPRVYRQGGGLQGSRAAAQQLGQYFALAFQRLALAVERLTDHTGVFPHILGQHVNFSISPRTGFPIRFNPTRIAISPPPLTASWAISTHLVLPAAAACNCNAATASRASCKNSASMLSSCLWQSGCG